MDFKEEEYLLTLKWNFTYFKEIQEFDYSKITQWLNDPDFNKLLYQGWDHVSVESFSKQVNDEKLLEDARIFSQFSKSNDELVGWCGLFFPTSQRHKAAQKAEVRSFIGKEFWGKGYGTEQHMMLVKFGFDYFNLNRIFFGTHQDNIGTQKIYKKLNFIKEGVLRQDFFRTYFADIHRYSILKNEYESQTKSIIQKSLLN